MAGSLLCASLKLEGAAVDVSSKLIDGTTMKTNDVLDLAAEFLGKGYTEPVAGSGRFVSADGMRVFRMGKMQIVKNIHIFLGD
ncbi:MAG: hypothetical protein K6G65_07730 [Lachnospiraceae bacterium]|nr:hypothetical protein [Lachnospiraceae bacterium]